MSECTHDCSTCGQACASRTAPQDLHEKPNELSSVKKVIAVVSGKGGVGKSLVTSALAVELNRRGHKTAILARAKGSEFGIIPETTKTGIDIMSINLLLEHNTDPVVWRGPVISGTVKQFWTDVIWKDVDYLFVDMPPGTGDVPLTVFQSLPLDGIIVVASPQELVSMIVSKAVKMAELMNVPILGLVENMSYFKCPDCGKEHKIFGESHIDEIAAQYGTRVLAKVPMDAELAKSVDTGTIELFVGNWFENAANTVEDELKV